MDSTRRWTFLTNHAHVLLALAQAPDMRLREIAAAVGITERATFSIVRDLEEAGYVRKRKVGRRNVYEVDRGLHLRHPLEQDVEVGRLLDLTQPPG